MYLDKNKILESLTEDDVIKVVTSLGSAPPRRGTKNELIFQTICHNEPNVNNSWKLYYYPPCGSYKIGNFYCYSGCQDSFNIVELILRAYRTRHKTMTFFQALNYLAGITGYTYEAVKLPKQHHVIDDWGFIEKFKKADTLSAMPQLPTINENILDMFYYVPHEDFINDHISIETISEFEISYWGKTNQIVLPHRDYLQHLVGIRGRFLSDYDVQTIGKYAPLCVEGKFLSHPLGDNLYGIHINQFKIKECKKVLLVEGEKGVLQNHSYFGADDFSLATCGSSISKTQISILIQYLGVEEVILGYDKMFHQNGTYEEIVYRNKIFKKIAPLLSYCKVSLLWDKEDIIEYKQSPTDYGKEVLLHLLNNKIEITKSDIEEMMKQDDELVYDDGGNEYD